MFFGLFVSWLYQAIRLTSSQAGRHAFTRTQSSYAVKTFPCVLFSKVMYIRRRLAMNDLPFHRWSLGRCCPKLSDVARSCPSLPEALWDCSMPSDYAWGCPRLSEVARGCPRLPEVSRSYLRLPEDVWGGPSLSDDARGCSMLSEVAQGRRCCPKLPEVARSCPMLSEAVWCCPKLPWPGLLPEHVFHWYSTRLNASTS